MENGRAIDDGGERVVTVMYGWVDFPRAAESLRVGWAPHFQNSQVLLVGGLTGVWLVPHLPQQDRPPECLLKCVPLRRSWKRKNHGNLSTDVFSQVDPTSRGMHHALLSHSREVRRGIGVDVRSNASKGALLGTPGRRKEMSQLPIHRSR